MKTFTSFRATTRNPAFNLFSRMVAVFGLVMMFAVSGWGNVYTDALKAFASCGTTDTTNSKVIELNSSAGYSAHTLTGVVDENNGPYDVFIVKITQDLNISYAITNTGNNNLRVDANSSCNSVSATALSPGGVKSGTIQIAASAISPYYLYLYLESTENNQDTTYSIQISIDGAGGDAEDGIGHGDFIDTPITDASLSGTYNASADTSSSGIKFIKTKIAAKTTPLTAVYLNDLGVNADYDNNSTGDLDSKLWFAIPVLNDINATGGCPSANSSLLQQIIDPTTNQQVVFMIKDFGFADYSATKSVIIPSNASKNARIEMILVDTSKLNEDAQNCVEVSSTTGNLEGLGQCVNSEVQYVDAYGQTAYDRCAVSTTYGQPCLPENHGVGTGLFNTPLGCFMCTFYAGTACSSDNFAIRPNYFSIDSTQTAFPNLLRSAEDYNLSVYAYDYGVTSGTNGTNDYNITGATSLFDLNTTKYNRDGDINASMYGTAVWSAYDFNMSDGVSWSSAVASGVTEVAGVQFNDVGKINLKVIDENWATVDIDDTLQDCSADGAYICGDKNVTYIPYYFDFHDLNITNNNGNPGTFTYIANEVAQMAGRIHTTMRALNKSGDETRNFATYPLWENNVTVIPVVVKSTYLYPDANETNITNLSIGFSDGNKTVTWNETNTSQYLRFNFRRDVNQTAIPFDVNGTDLNISMLSHYVDAEDGDVADINGSRLGTGVLNLPYTVVSPADGNTTFLYGRVIPRDIRVFGDVDFTANAWYEVYNAPMINGNLLSPSKNDALWYTNRLHNDINDGDGNVTRLQSAPTVSTAVNIGSASSGTGIETYSFTHVGAGNIPYSRKAHIDTDPWLWYGVNALDYLDPSAANLDCLTHPCFNINIVPAVGATGSQKSGDGVNKSSKKSDSSGTWKSTNDYAPAVR